jgi:hypothetical protein
VGAIVAVAVAVGVGEGVAEAAGMSIIKVQSASPTLLFPAGAKTRVPTFDNPVPIVVYVALVGSNQRARDEPLMAAMSTVIDPLWAGGR